MHVTFDPEKNETNMRRRGLSFEQAVEFNFETAHVQTDERRDYGETRYVALGKLRDRLHVLCFTETPDGIRVISLSQGE